MFCSVGVQVCTDETCAEESHGHGHGHGHAAAAAAAASAEGKESHGHGHAAAHGHGHGANIKAKKKVHDLSRVGSVGIMLEGHLDNIKFNYFMGTLLRERSSDLYRSKGVLSIHGQVCRPDSLCASVCQPLRFSAAALLSRLLSLLSASVATDRATPSLSFRVCTSRSTSGRPRKTGWMTSRA